MIKYTLLFLIPVIISCKSQKDTKSASIGKVNNGSLKNGVKFPYKGKNYSYFSSTSYYILNRSYVHNKVKSVTLNAYKNLNKRFPKQKWGIMECSRKHGGKMKPHRTHQNGTSIDFMTPMKWLNSKNQYRWKAHLGVWHYLLTFDKDGYLNKRKKVQIDFNMIALHILELNKEAKKQGLTIKKVILKINLKDNLFKCENGEKLKLSGIYFAKYLTPIVDNMHDDHYHVDFGV
jgi:penicillin-insensitive murein endopeptidase